MEFSDRGAEVISKRADRLAFLAQLIAVVVAVYAAALLLMSFE
jgi:hypothetical protein